MCVRVECRACEGHATLSMGTVRVHAQVERIASRSFKTASLLRGANKEDGGAMLSAIENPLGQAKVWMRVW